MTAFAPLRVAYFTNQYPAPSHSFIRREIRALEELGVGVVRYAVRPSAAPLADEDDRAEFAVTRHLTKAPKSEILGALIKTVLLRPLATLRALGKAVKLGRGSDRGVLRNLAYAAEGAVLAAWCRRDRVQHVHAHFGTNPAAIAMFAQAFGGVPFSFTVHGPDEFDRAPALALDTKLRHSAFAVCVSAFGRSQLMRWTAPDQWPKINLIHCGVDKGFGTAPPAPLPAAPRLLCVGRLCAQKAQLLLVEAVRKLRDRGIAVELVLAGDGEMRAGIETAIAAAGLQDRVSITGWISGERVRQELAAARVFVLPSFAENLPVVIMEAMALGRPVVSTYIAGIPELVTPGETGWLVPAGDVDALTDALTEALAASDTELAEMGLAGRARVVNRHDVIKEAGKLKVLFEASASVVRAASHDVVADRAVKPSSAV